MILRKDTAIVADNPEAAKNMAFEIDQSKRRMKKFVAELLPVLNPSHP